MPADAHLKPPPVRDRNTVEECDEVTRSSSHASAISGAGLRASSAMRAEANERLKQVAKDQAEGSGAAKA